ncbi:DUF4954 family protein [Chitinispirillales bacterium ANBcel5]|uniref:DUF4954 family protein n=1 Tax=Cellulosispirillum alkaliphilum TaxID=3039283 RepID=UPI002A56B85C|nr:DUF4954 family protein [Chitinispirillales bacterium ANBcel5]
MIKETEKLIVTIDTSAYRPLNEQEKKSLTENRNRAIDWKTIYVKDGFDPSRVHGCTFWGSVYIGSFSKESLSHDNLILPVGIYDSFITDCIIEDNVAMHKVSYCKNVSINSEVILFNCAEVDCSEEPCFGTGIDRWGKEVNKVSIINENGGRAILPFIGINCTDAFIWSKYRDDLQLLENFQAFSAQAAKTVAGKEGVISAKSVVINAKSIRNAIIGEGTVIDSAERLENVTILSDLSEPTVIGSAVIIKDSIIGYGNTIETATQLYSSVSGTAVSVSQCSRITESFIGDNAHVCCCEIANALLSPSHAQHHNNSFLIASMIGGQSNIAAGATIGSNHNSRVNDGEVWAKRGFWPGLCVSLKHNSSFASFTMIAKGDYPSEIDLKLPFSLLCPDRENNSTVLIPAFWFTHDMYAFMRNALKFKKRDKRVHRHQFIEHEVLAPDTVEEMFSAMDLLELLVGKSFYIKEYGRINGLSDKELIAKGNELLTKKPEICSSLTITVDNVERGNKNMWVKNCCSAWSAYKMMIRYYAIKSIVNYQKSPLTFSQIKDLMPEKRSVDWVNCAGMLLSKADLSDLKERVYSGNIKDWNQVHEFYKKLEGSYKDKVVQHALSSLTALNGLGKESYGSKDFLHDLDSCAADCEKIAYLTRSSREKDYLSPFRLSVYDNSKEMESVLGPLSDDGVILETEQEMRRLKEKIEELRTVDSSWK